MAKTGHKSEKTQESFDQKVDALRMRVKDLDQLKVRDNVFDEQTLLALYKLITKKWIDSVGGPLSTGKEANIFYGEREGRTVVIKIYMMRTANFLKMQEYIAGDRRFLHIGKSKKDVIFAWTKKEFSNLKRAVEAGVNVPFPLIFDRNILVMDLIGENNVASPQLRLAEIDKPYETYKTLMESVRDLWQKANLVHGDLSEYNILYHKGEPVIIDIGQAVTTDHAHAHSFLKRDIENVNRFFASRCAVRETNDLLDWICGISPDKENDMTNY